MNGIDWDKIAPPRPEPSDRNAQPLTESEQQQAWWDSLTAEQREDYEDAMERDRNERHAYGRVLTEDERVAVREHFASVTALEMKIYADTLRELASEHEPETWAEADDRERDAFRDQIFGGFVDEPAFGILESDEIRDNIDAAITDFAAGRY